MSKTFCSLLSYGLLAAVGGALVWFSPGGSKILAMLLVPYSALVVMWLVWLRHLPCSLRIAFLLALPAHAIAGYFTLLSAFAGTPRFVPPIWTTANLVLSALALMHIHRRQIRYGWLLAFVVCAALPILLTLAVGLVAGLL